MKDEMVLEVQKWVNNTYEEALITSGWGLVIENGNTGWDVINGLIIGLQVELELTSYAPNFGEGTIAAMNNYGNISQGSNDQNNNINKIIQGGCWCTGYNPNNFDGIFDENLTSAMKQLESNIGIEKTGIVDTKLMKGLLTMNAYVTILDGTEMVRTFQQWLNNTYKPKSQFYYIPCDGLYSRDTQEGIVYGIQFECELDDVANGWFGPTTQENLKNKGLVYLDDVDTTNNFVHLFKGAFLCNNKSSLVPFNGSYGDLLYNEVKDFQAFMALDINGNGDYQTWCDLLVSTGDSSRLTKALDCSVEKVSQERAILFKSLGYETIGRYLTNDGGTLDKKLEQYEIDNIFNNGMSIFPIYQTYHHLAEHFTYENGKQDADDAIKIAKFEYNIPAHTTIYFPVDFDAYQTQVENEIAEYFRGLNDRFLGRGYNIGVYGARNTCSIISNLGYAKYSFVSGMSIGFSGNLGFPMPANWSFNQIYEDYNLGIDNDVKSQKDSGFNKQVTPNENLLEQMQFIYSLALEYADNEVEYANKLFCDVYRKDGGYDNANWFFLFGGVDKVFTGNVMEELSNRDEELISLYSEPITNKEIDLNHMMATTYAFIHTQTDNGSELTKGDVGGWLGDFVSLMRDYTDFGRDEGLSTYDFVIKYCGSDLKSTYPYSDYVSDADGFNISVMLKEDPNIVSCLSNYMTNGDILKRNNLFYQNRQLGSQVMMHKLVEDLVTLNVSDILSIIIKKLYIGESLVSGILNNDFTDDFTDMERDGLINGYIDVQNTFINKE